MKDALRRAGILSAVALLTVGIAAANVVPTFETVSGSGGLFTYTYSVGIDQFQFVQTGDQLCLADVPGLTGTATAPTNWTATESTSSACPFNAGVTRPNVPGSVLFTYTGAPTIPAGTTIGTFTFQDTIGTSSGLIAYGATSFKVSDSQATANQGEVAGPSTVPEPASLAMLGLGLIAVFIPKRRRS